MTARVFYRHLKWTAILLQLFFCPTLIAQSSSQHETLIKSASDLIYSNPDEAIKIAHHLLNTAHENSGSNNARLNMLMAKSYITKGDYNNAIRAVFQAGFSANTTIREKIEIDLLKSDILTAQYLDKQANKYSLKARRYVPELTRADASMMMARIDLQTAHRNLSLQEYKKALGILKSTQRSHKTEFNANPDLDQELISLKGTVYSKLAQQDSAALFIRKALAYNKARKNPNYLERIALQNELGNLYFSRKQYKEAIALLLSSLKCANIIGNRQSLKSINRQLSINYLAIDNKAKYKSYDDAFRKLSEVIDELEQETLNSAYSLINKEDLASFENQQTKYTTYLYVTLSIFSVTLVIILILLFKSHLKKKRLGEIINYLEITRNRYEKLSLKKKEPAKNLTISVEAEQALLNKLKRFENSARFTNKEMSLAVLAAQLDTNTKYLSEVINKHYHDNFNTYINKLRVTFIIDKLKNDSNYKHYKISYLADKSGFSSHSSFATVFKSITGMAPGTFIDLLKEDVQLNEPVS